MARRHKSQSATVLADHTFGLTELTVHFVHPNQKNMELLPYPDDNFNDTIDVRCKRSWYTFFFFNYFTLAPLSN